MLEKDATRKCFLLTKPKKKLNGYEIKEIPIKDIKAGDIFQLYEPTGEIVKDDKGNDTFVAEHDAYRQDSRHIIDCHPLNKEPIVGEETSFRSHRTVGRYQY